MNNFVEPFMETFPNPADAIGWCAAEECTPLEWERTDKPELIAQGYTWTVYVVDQCGLQWSVIHNPTSELYAGAHLSSG